MHHHEPQVASRPSLDHGRLAGAGAWDDDKHPAPSLCIHVKVLYIACKVSERIHSINPATATASVDVEEKGVSGWFWLVRTTY